VRRYPDRALLMPTTRCASYCRFCFRRETVGRGEAGLLPKAELEAAFAYLASEKDIWEVILTGGDPLILSPRRLSAIMVRLAEIPHIRIVRVHTRTPAVAPERITPALIRALKSGGQTVYVALHANHPRELTPEVRGACARLIDAGLPMLSQTVLLRHVNDDPETLASLMRAFVEMRIRPYYLHHGDLAPGTAHLRTDLADSQALARGLRGRLSGLCQPTLILDIPGGHGKVPAAPAYVRAASDGAFEVEDPQGCVHAYPPKNQAID